METAASNSDIKYYTIEDRKVIGIAVAIFCLGLLIGSLYGTIVTHHLETAGVTADSNATTAYYPAQLPPSSAGEVYAARKEVLNLMHTASVHATLETTNATDDKWESYTNLSPQQLKVTLQRNSNGVELGVVNHLDHTVTGSFTEIFNDRPYVRTYGLILRPGESTGIYGADSMNLYDGNKLILIGMKSLR